LRPETLEDEPSVVYVLDSNLRLAYCNKAWDEFAMQNGGAHLLRNEQLGRSVLDSISGPLKPFYGSVFERTLADQQPWEHVYECSSPDCYREFHERVLPLKAPPRLVVVNSLVVDKAHERSASDPVVSRYRASGVIVMCSHCRRTRRSAEPNIWDWVPAFLAAPPDNVSHGLCPVCGLYYYPEVFTGECPQ
jgi:hypothetical protein